MLKWFNFNFKEAAQSGAASGSEKKPGIEGAVLNAAHLSQGIYT